MDWNPKTIRELIEEIGDAARGLGIGHATIVIGGDSISLSLHPPPIPPPPPPPPLDAKEEQALRFSRAKAEIELQYGHTGHVPTNDEVLEWMAQRGTV